MNQRAYTQLSGELDGHSGNCIFSGDGFYLGFVFDDRALGVRCHDGTTIKDIKGDPARYLAEDIEPVRDGSDHIDNFLF